jgi:5-methyltetrahydrofolate--homocysteine methyltransferase
LFGPDDLTAIIGERINPTGRSKLAEELSQGKLDIALADARAQAEAGADYISVNVGAAGVDEAKLLPLLVMEVAESTGLAICVDSADPAALVAALDEYRSPRAIINSITADDQSMDTVLPLVEKYGCFVIAMTKDKKSIPDTPQGRSAMAERLLERAETYGIPRERVLIDCLTFPAATAADAALATLQSIRHISDKLRCPVVLGASNISFGMPSRLVINRVFLAMAIQAGLKAAIVNPLESDLVLSIRAADFLSGKDRMGRSYLKYYREHRE